MIVLWNRKKLYIYEVKGMLISNLGRTRTKLLTSFQDLSDEQLNRKPSDKSWSIAQVLHHLYTSEKAMAGLVLDALQAKTEKVEEKDLSFVTDRTKKSKAMSEPPNEMMTKENLLQLLEESRFQHLQFVFNETHERILAKKSMKHQDFGEISLKNAVNLIWLHEKRHINQIQEIRQQLNF